MNLDFQRLMKAATRFTRGGDLRAATAAIQSALMRNAPARERPQTDDVIDVQANDVAAAPRALHAQTAPPPAATAQPLGGGEFIAGRFATATDGRDYKLYIPPQAGQRPLPLVVMLHGCTQNPDDFAAGTGMNEAARAQGFFVLYPAQSQKANAHRCWNWFKHNHQERGRGEPALLAGMTRDVMARHAIDPARVFVAGLSAGGAMAAIMGEAYPELFAAVGVHSGLAAGSANDLPSALGAMKRSAAKASGTASGVPTIVFHGDADGTVHPANGAHVIAASVHSAADVQTEQGLATGGHRYTRHVHRGTDGGQVVAEHWVVHGAAHAWSGGSAKGSYTDPRGPDATAEMLRFFMGHGTTR
ncbi:MAG: Esterase, depolymerase [Ramlibacter sp.]|jgi:poly(hydroxyalkanoate) depolymerase family esterase|nr:Esterase, depolymerase [Ramlibacter sp.]